jgi:protein Cut8
LSAKPYKGYLKAVCYPTLYTHCQLNMVISAVLPPPTGWGFEFARTPEPKVHRHQHTFELVHANNSRPKRKLASPDRIDEDSEDENRHADMDAFSSTFHSKLSTTTKPRQFKVAKRMRLRTVTGHPLSVSRMLESLDKKGLCTLIENICQTRPDIAQEINGLVPRVTVSTAIENLKKRLAAIYENLPFKGEPRGDYAYLRVRPAVDEFLSALADYTGYFLPPTESQPSNTLAFLDKATELLHEVPIWTNPLNNHSRFIAYEELSAAWTVSIREASKRAGGLGLVHDGWQTKLEKHNSRCDGRLDDALACINEELSWLQNDYPPNNHFASFSPSQAVAGPATPLWT